MRRRAAVVLLGMLLAVPVLPPAPEAGAAVASGGNCQKVERRTGAKLRRALRVCTRRHAVDAASAAQCALEARARRERRLRARGCAPAGGTEAASAAGTWVGPVAGTDALVALVADGGRVLAFVCGGAVTHGTHSGWWAGALTHDRFQLTAAETSYGATARRLTGGRAGQGFAGTLVTEDGRSWPWTATPAGGETSGLFLRLDPAGTTAAILGDDGRFAGTSTLPGSTRPVAPGGAPRADGTLRVVVDTGTLPALPPVDLVRVTGPNLEPPPPSRPPTFLEVKFEDGVRVRLKDAKPIDLGRSLGTAAERLFAELAARKVRWYRMHAIPEARLQAMRARATARLGRPVPDLGTWFVLELPAGIEPEPVLLGLNQLSAIEYAFFLPVGVLPVVPDMTDPANPSGAFQAYLFPAATQNGIDARYAWTHHRGAGIRVCDVEYNFDPTHPDLPPVEIVGDPPSGDTAARPDYIAHGTKVLGEMASLANGIGTTGIAPEASFHFAAVIAGSNPFPSIAGAIARCADRFAPGDVILVEQQVAGPNCREDDDCTGANQDGLVPAEWYRSVYDAILTAVGNGIVVVEAAGNGGEDLDDPIYLRSPFPFMPHHAPFVRSNDSGAILVGAGRPFSVSTFAAREPLDFTNFGARVDVQGWGSNVVTTGPGGAGEICDDPDGDGTLDTPPCYELGFSGTSAASPIVTGAVALLQGLYVKEHGRAMTPEEVRALLIQSGVPQPAAGADRHIGPLPDLRLAVDVVRAAVPAPVVTPPDHTTFDDPVGQVRLDYGPGMHLENAALLYTLNGEAPDFAAPPPHTFEYVPDPGNASVYVPIVRSVRLHAQTFLRAVFDPATGEHAASRLVARNYYVADPAVGAVRFSVPAGAHAAPIAIRMTHPDPTATIWYTRRATADLDAVPSPQGFVADGTSLAFGTLALDGSGPQTIKARAYVLGPDGQITAGPATTITYDLQP